MPIGVRYGLSLEEFYRMNPRKLERYQPFLLERFKRTKENDSELGWIGGQYVARAIGAVMPKGKRYPDEPIRFYGSQEDEDGNVITDADRFQAFAAMFNKANEGKFLKESDQDADITADQNTDSVDTDTKESQ